MLIGPNWSHLGPIIEIIIKTRGLTAQARAEVNMRTAAIVFVRQKALYSVLMFWTDPR